LRQRYGKLLLEKIEAGQIDPSFIITHRVFLEGAATAYKTFRDKEDGCIKVVLKPSGQWKGFRFSSTKGRFSSFGDSLLKRKSSELAKCDLAANNGCSDGFRDIGDIVFPQSGACVRIHSKKYIDFGPAGHAIVSVYHSCAIPEK
jgi:hypothetical protein